MLQSRTSILLSKTDLGLWCSRIPSEKKREIFIKRTITNLHLFYYFIITESNLLVMAVKQLWFIPKTVALIQVNKVIPIPLRADCITVLVTLFTFRAFLHSHKRWKILCWWCCYWGGRGIDLTRCKDEGGVCSQRFVEWSTTIMESILPFWGSVTCLC